MSKEGKAQRLSYGEQVALLMRMLAGLRSNREDPRFETVIGYVRDLPEATRPDNLYELVARGFSCTINDVKQLLDVKLIEKRPDFESLIPDGGFLRDYVEYTRTTEPPTVFHFFTGAVALGATLARHVSYNLGFGYVFPNMCVILVAPSGKCRKTSCCEMGIKFYRGIGGTILADKITPEALVMAFEDKPTATGLIYAGELAQFLGKQKYMEGMIPLLTRLFDCPDVWTSATVGRKEITLKNVAFSMLGASTMDWLRSLPGDSFGGGFMSRFLFVVQEETPRSFPLPPPLDDTRKAKLLNHLMKMTHVRGAFQMTPSAKRWYIDWYHSLDGANTEKQFSGYYERKPAHVIRLSMVMTLSKGDDLVLEKRVMEQSLRILDWAESYLPGAFEQLNVTTSGEDNVRIIKQLKKAGGGATHSDLLRKNSSRMKASQFKEAMSTLRESKLVDWDQANRTYYLTPEGWKQ